jgi:hypothetical protein
LQRIGNLYAIEAEGKDLTIENRQQLREEKSLAELKALHGWLVKTRTQTANGGGSAKALDYTLKRWASLIRYARGCKKFCVSGHFAGNCYFQEWIRNDDNKNFTQRFN